MRYILYVLLIMLVFVSLAVADQAEAPAVKTMSLALVAVQPANADLALSATMLQEQLLATFRQPVQCPDGQPIQCLAYFIHQRSPMVQRAIMEGDITLEDCTLITEPKHAVKLGIAIGADAVVVPQIISCQANEGTSGWSAKVVLGLSLVKIKPNCDSYCLTPLPHIRVAFTGLATGSSGDTLLPTKNAAIRAAVTQGYHSLLSALLDALAPAPAAAT